jgi:murein DD-endopeptidase MepM/ murein hydrolase activator NlpD
VGVKFYTVKKGDTLSGIGKSLGVPWAKIAEFNKLKNPNKIGINQVVMIPDLNPQPVQQAVAEPPPPKKTYKTPDMGDEQPRPPPMNVEVVQAKDVPQGPQGPRPAEAWGPGHSKPYPAGPSQVGYPEFWADFAKEKVPEALMGAKSTPFAALIRGASKLREWGDEALGSADTDAARMAFRQRNARYRQSTQDPNYEQVREVGLPAGRQPDPRVGGMDFLRAMFDQLVGSPTYAQAPGYMREVAPRVNPLRGMMAESQEDAGRATEPGPGADYPKGTYAYKRGPR